MIGPYYRVRYTEQLTEIYYKYEDWHTIRMAPESALRYHIKAYENGNIHVYEYEGEYMAIMNV